MAKVPVIEVGKWNVGYAHQIDRVVIQLDFSDRDPLVFGIPAEQAQAFADAIAAARLDATKSRN